MWDTRRIVTTVALVSAGGVVWLAASNADSGREAASSSPETSATQLTARPVGPEARKAASARQQVPGTPRTDVAPGLDFGQPKAVAEAYLVAAHTVTAADRGKTNRRVLPYLAPDNPANPRGLVVAENPPPGRMTTVTVDELRVVGSNESGGRIAYEARWSVSIDESAKPGTRRITFVVLARQPDGRWLVTRESARLQPGD